MFRILKAALTISFQYLASIYHKSQIKYVSGEQTC